MLGNCSVSEQKTKNTRVDLYSTGIIGHALNGLRLVDNTGTLFIHHVIGRVGAVYWGLRGCGGGGKSLI